MLGRRAIEIRNLNRIRVGIKNRIAEVTGSGYKDIKMNHVSEYPKEYALHCIDIEVELLHEIFDKVNREIEYPLTEEERLDIWNQYSIKRKI